MRSSPRIAANLIALAIGIATVAPAAAQVASRATQPFFVENRGQLALPVRYRVRSAGLSIHVLNDGIVFDWKGDVAQPPIAPGPRNLDLRALRERRDRRAPWQAAVWMHFAGAASQCQITSERPLPGRMHWYRGDLRIEDVPICQEVVYRDLYAGIDLALRCDGETIKSEWRLDPGVDPDVIRWRYAGAERVSISEGSLRIDTALGTLWEAAPVIYESGNRAAVAGRYTIDASGLVGFDVDAHDPSQGLVIDPVFAWSALLGSDEFDEAQDVALDAAGNAYVCGDTAEDDFPATPGLLPYRGDDDAFVARFDPAGNLLTATFFGGFDFDEGKGIALHAPSGQVFLVGTTDSEFGFPPMRLQMLGASGPMVGAAAGGGDGYLAVFDSSLSLIYTTFIGGSFFEECDDVAVDDQGDVYVSGHTDSLDFPVTPGVVQQAPGGNTDAFVLKIDAAGTTRLWSTYLGGAADDDDVTLALDAVTAQQVEVCLTGSTTSAGFPVVPNPSSGLPPGPVGLQDVFVARLDASATALRYSSYVGGNGDDEASSIAVDADGNAYVVGETDSTSFQPALRGALGGSLDGFLLKVDRNGTLAPSLTPSYVGGSQADAVLGVALAASAPGMQPELYLAGATYSPDAFANPAPYPISSAHGGSLDAWLAEVKPNGTIGALTYFGTSAEEYALAVRAVGNHGAVIVGATWSPTLTATPGTHHGAYKGGGDAFLARFADGAAMEYGSGVFGSGPCIPALSAWGYTVPGGTFHLDVRNAIGGSMGLLAIGAAPASLPLGCGSLLVVPVLGLGVSLGGTGPCGGFADVPIQVPNNTGLSGGDVFFQFIGVDPNACWRTSLFTLSNGLQVRIG
jgi:hypothetical protein